MRTLPCILGMKIVKLEKKQTSNIDPKLPQVDDVPPIQDDEDHKVTPSRAATSALSNSLALSDRLLMDALNGMTVLGAENQRQHQDNTRHRQHSTRWMDTQPKEMELTLAP